MIIHLAGDVDYDMMKKLCAGYNNLDEDEILTVYFTSPEGGMTDVSEAILNFFNTNENIEVVFYGELFSSGMYIFLKTQCKKSVLPDTRGMYHLSYQRMYINETGKTFMGYDTFSMKVMKESKIKSLEHLSTTKMTAKEIKQIKQGKDVYFNYSRMLELI